MATYYHGNSEIQGADGLQQTLILMNPNFVGFSDTNPPPPSSSPANYTLQHAPSQFHATPHLQPQPQPHQLVGIPLQQSVVASGTTTSAASQSPSTDHAPRHREISTLHGYPAARLNYSDLWNNLAAGSIDTRDSTRSQQGLSLSLYTQQQSPSYGSRGNDHRPHEFPSPRAAPTLSQPPPGSGSGSGAGAGDVRVSGYLSAAGLSGGVTGMLSILLGSKYLKAAQELLEEVVSVGHGIGAELLKKTGGGKPQQPNRGSPATGGTGEGLTVGEAKLKGGEELTTMERQEIQMKKAKLITLLDEVEQRYRQYHHQMQAVISSFEQAAGIGSAKTYTALALRTISKQFRSLKDAILGQVKAANESLGEEESHHKGSGGGNNNTGTSTTEGSTRLKFIDHQIRQQRALQQLGMMHNNAWRPQRGLPEKAVTVLRAWLFEHFLHPYPKDSDKIMLAQHTGLSRSQVSNWFINARVRLWKPMIEEMYSEEIKEQEQNIESEDHKPVSLVSPKEDHPSTSKSISQDRSNNSEDKQFQMNGNSKDHKNNPPPMTSVSTTPTTFRGINPALHNSSTQNQSGFSLLSPSEMEILSQASPKRQRSTDHELRSSPSTQVVPMMDHMDNANSNGANNGEILINFGDNHENKQNKGYHHHYQRMQEYPTNFLGGFGSYPIGEIGRFDAEQFPQRFSGNGSVSLTLGLPHCENNHHHHLSLSETNQGFLHTNQDIQFMRGRRDDSMGDQHTSNDFGDIGNQTPSHSIGGYESINIQEQKGYAAQLLPDFVA